MTQTGEMKKTWKHCGKVIFQHTYNALSMYDIDGGFLETKLYIF